MQKNKKTVVLIVLAAATLIIWIPKGKRSKGSAPPPALRPAAGSLEQVIPTIAPAAQPRSKFVDWGRNPFVWPKLIVSAVSDLRLSGIIWDEANSYAIINGAVVHSGDIIEGKTIKRIEPDKVVLSDDFKEYILKLEQPER